MIIRQNPLHEATCDLETERFCATVAAATIDAIADIFAMYPDTRSTTYFLVSSIAESVYQIVPFLKNEMNKSQRADALAALHTARRLLGELSLTEAATRVLDIVDSVIKDQQHAVIQESGGGEETPRPMALRFLHDNELHGFRAPRTDASGDIGLADFGMPTHCLMDDLFLNSASVQGCDTFDPSLFSIDMGMNNCVASGYGLEGQVNSEHSSVGSYNGSHPLEEIHSGLYN